MIGRSSHSVIVVTVCSGGDSGSGSRGGRQEYPEVRLCVEGGRTGRFDRGIVC